MNRPTRRHGTREYRITGAGCGTVTEEEDTTATVEFCDDGTGFEATKDGKPVEINNASLKVVGQFKLVRKSSSEPWMIQQKGYYDEETTCDAHFAG